ncbi:MAG: pantetheine-phosphate adenylyltransferase [Thermoplasmatota archaeon]
MRVCVGGTFEPLHAGHKAMLRAAAEGATELFVGFTASGLQLRPDRAVSYWPTRARVVERVLREEMKFQGLLRMAPLLDNDGPAASEPFDRIVVSPETVPGAEAINRRRRRSRLKALDIRIVPHVLAQDLLPVSGTAVHAGLIDAEGRRMKPIRIAVGSQNPVKLEAVQQEVARLFPGVATMVRGFPVRSGVHEQPEGRATLEGARNRAAGAAKAAVPEGFDYAIGIEAGLVRMPGEEGHHEVQACIVTDRLGESTSGWGPAFRYPEWVARRALNGEMVSAILGPLADQRDLGATTGAIGWLTDGRLDRVALTRAALVMAFVPRIRRHLYTIEHSP